MENTVRLIDQRREEIIGGEVVMMSPALVNHYRVARNIARIFENYLQEKTCEAFGNGVDLYLSENDQFIPDGMVVCDESKIHDDGIYGAPDLVVEVLSPSTASNDRIRKLETYGKYGVKEYWIVSVEGHSVEVFLPKNGELKTAYVYTLSPAVPVRNRIEQRKVKVLVTEFHCSLFPDLSISLEEIFSRLR